MGAVRVRVRVTVARALCCSRNRGRCCLLWRRSTGGVQGSLGLEGFPVQKKLDCVFDRVMVALGKLDDGLACTVTQSLTTCMANSCMCAPSHAE